MIINKIELPDNAPLELIEKHVANEPVNKIACVNWANEFPSKPEVSFKIGHNGTCLFLHFFVSENEILAQVKEDNGKVCNDSCVEFFVSFNDSPYYYNLELSCIGKALFGYRKERKDVIYGDAEIMSLIKRHSSLGDEPFDKKNGNFDWNMLVTIPVSAFWKSDLQTFDGVKARANFYKCGDHLTIPHYLSWAPIKTEKPNFHQPIFFENLIFND